ncbi:ribose-5-phosphate isomerase RpiA [Fictibacillus terranigra]|uniref:Ribose-5-phosphate isomerase A n=1 Tax=Fictibacillus terranigra TaxID=3058424 RepID=A0ABT8E7U5_9BACL|nr:ribose-5-phosphate isomerase RpiA [Fictibacillus sp. CENA-BCM004]MDN4073980.1 ribose-5-phosphate isomerase RpiA [Fictibacillus sp. CENA-BCM004]
MNEKQMAGEKAAEFIEDGMILGLGTGSTVYYMLQELGKRVQGGLNIHGVSTSKATTNLAKSLNIPLCSINDIDGIDLTIDGADEVDGELNGIKGGGGALLYEKVVASMSSKVIWIVDSAKRVDSLGRFPLPVEVLPFGSRYLFRIFEKEGLQPAFRKKGEALFITDSGHTIIDLKVPRMEDPQKTASWLDGLTGVIEHGLFLNMADLLIVGEPEGPTVVHRK